MICGYEISMRLFVVYWWFNTFFINTNTNTTSLSINFCEGGLEVPHDL